MLFQTGGTSLACVCRKHGGGAGGTIVLYLTFYYQGATL